MPVTGGQRYPLRLKSENGQRRLRLLSSVAQHEWVTMEAMASDTEVEDLRWLWDKDMVTVVDHDPLRYATNEIGHAVLEKANREAAAA
jgi:hypothetical protein